MTTSAKRLAVGPLAVVALLLASCGGDAGGGELGAAGTGEPQAGGTLVYGVGADVNGFDPTVDPFAQQSYTMGGTIMESLVAIDAEGNWQPYLAESLEPGEDFTQWTITVRDGITFHNGETLTAQVVAANLEAQKVSPLNAAVLLPLASIDAVDDRSVVVTMSSAWSTFPVYLAGTIGMVIPMASLDDDEAAGRAPVGTGPFVFSEYVPDSRFVVTRNPDYWRDGFPYLDEIEFRIIPDTQTISQTFDSGGVDAIQTTNDEHFVKYLAEAEDGDVQVFRPDGMSVQEFFWMLNTKVPPLDDVRVRRALAHATDRQVYVDALRSGLTEPADSPWTQDSKWYAESNYPTFDLAKATALVAEYEAENGPIRINILTPPDDSPVENAVLAQSQWSQAGVEVTIEKLDQPTLITRVLTGDFQASTWLYFNAPDPDGEHAVLHPMFAAPIGKIATNPSRIDDPALGAALEQGRSTTDEAVREEAYATVQERLGELVPFVWMDHLTTAGVVASPEVHAVTEYTLPGGEPGLPLEGMTHPFHQVWKEQ